jgi:tRNA (guanine26-N2/guanine27-N2)-dimethyltransferase
MYVSEGDVEVVVPEQSEGNSDEVFYNPVQELNRDLTVAVLRAYREREPRAATYLDATAASGIRGVRAASEGWEITCADVDPDAVELCRENLTRNDLAGTVCHTDANPLLHQEYFDVVDVDPFGTPIPFADAAFQGTRNLLCVTATDTAPLCGAHFKSGVRSYSAVPRNTEYHAEMGVRILLSALVRTGARYDVAANPILTHASDHYVRTYLELDRGARVANATLEDVGYIYHCQQCLRRQTERGLTGDPPPECPNCGHHVQTAGPVWLGRTCDPEFLDVVRSRVTSDLATGDEVRSLLQTLANELPVPTHYDQHRLTKRWGRPAPSMAAFLDELRSGGYRASRTHYGGTTFKTTASVPVIRDITSELG